MIRWEAGGRSGSNQEVNVKKKRLVAVFFEGEPSRDMAAQFCDELVRRFWAHSTFDVYWCAVGDLAEEATSREAARRAAEAEMVVFAMPGKGEPAWEVQAWACQLIDLRREREGALVGLLEPGEGAHSGRFQFLRNLAHRAGMDYLTQVPDVLCLEIPDSLESYSQRAAEVTGVLDDILKHSRPPQGFVR